MPTCAGAEVPDDGLWCAPGAAAHQLSAHTDVSDLGRGALQGGLERRGRPFVSHESEPVSDGRFSVHLGTVSDQVMLDSKAAPKMA